jgi:hypothetical protein
MPPQQFTGIVEIMTSQHVSIPIPITITFDGDHGNIRLNGNVVGSGILLKNADGQETVNLQGDARTNAASGTDAGGALILKNATGQETIWLMGQGANLWLGTKDVSGDITLRNVAGQDTINFSGEGGNVSIDGTVSIGGTVGIGTTEPKALLHVAGTENGQWGMILSSEKGSAHGLKISTAYEGHEHISLLEVGGITVRRFDIRANGNAYFYKEDGSPSIHFDANAGDIELLGADCAEDFDVEESQLLEPGTVMVLDQAGKLQQSIRAYDKKVVGVLSGAGDYKPGVVLDKKSSQRKRMPLALVGKVYCKVDARFSPIETGDLLTTSPTPGHAMKADDPFKAFGAVIGKALRPLRGGQGLIPILVALQ